MPFSGTVHAVYDLLHAAARVAPQITVLGQDQAIGMRSCNAYLVHGASPPDIPPLQYSFLVQEEVVNVHAPSLHPCTS